MAASFFEAKGWGDESWGPPLENRRTSKKNPPDKFALSPAIYFFKKCAQVIQDLVIEAVLEPLTASPDAKASQKFQE